MSSYWALTAQRALSHVVPHGNLTRQRWHCPQMLMFRNIMCLRSHYGIYGRLVHIQISWKFPHLYGKQVAPVVSMYDTCALPVNRKEEWTTGPWKYSLKRQYIFFVVVQPLKSCPTLWDPMDCCTPGSSVLHYLPEFAQTHIIHWVADAI